MSRDEILGLTERIDRNGLLKELFNLFTLGDVSADFVVYISRKLIDSDEDYNRFLENCGLKQPENSEAMETLDLREES